MQLEKTLHLPLPLTVALSMENVLEPSFLASTVLHFVENSQIDSSRNTTNQHI